MNELQNFDGAWARIQPPSGPGPHPVIVMLHGLTGDEDVMWIFASRLPQNALLIAPRGLFPLSGGGYSWQAAASEEGSAGGRGFEEGIKFLDRLLSPENFPEANLDQVSLVGFSQGAALAFTFALTHPERVAALAGLAGFMPRAAQPLAQSQPLAGRQVFIAHGTRDEIVPYSRALEAKTVFEEAGAQVVLCSDDVGHKLSANCFRGLEAYFKNQSEAHSGPV